jgi:deoxyribonuclease-4
MGMGEDPQTQAGVQAVTENRPDRGYDPEDEYRPEVVEVRPPAWMDGTYRIGIHTSIAGHVKEALETAQSLGANALQIFSASPRMWTVAHPESRGFGTEARMRFTATEAAEFRARREELKLGPLVIHANYLINLASLDRVLRVRSIQAFHDEIVRAVALGADYLVLHPGAAKGGSVRAALDMVAQGLRQGARGVRLGSLRILLENTAGQGTALGATFSELKIILDACSDLPMGVCIDTAHLLAAGFEIRTEGGLEKTLQAIEATVGLANVFVVHVNDSKVPLGARADRHEHIGQGLIGLEAFARILRHPFLAPPSPDTRQEGILTRGFILETPIDKPGDDARNVAALWKLIGRPIEVRAARDGFRARKKRKAKVKSRKGKPQRRKARRGPPRKAKKRRR